MLPVSLRWLSMREAQHRNRGPAMGTYDVTVADGEIVTADRVGAPASGEEEIEVPTLSGLISMARTASDDAEVTTKYDPADGHPLEVTIDIGAEDSDGACCFTVTGYRPS
jgi:hypothetical protein